MIIKAERLFDGEEIVQDAVVAIDGDRITAVDAGQEFETNARDGEVTLRCRFAMPGLIDSHVHVAGYHEGSPAGAPFRPMHSFMRLLIYNGVTTVRDTGNSIETIKYLRQWGEKFVGPRLFGSGPLLDIPPLMWPFSRIVREPESARREVELLHLEGMDFIKAYRNVTPPVLKAIVEAADSFEMDVAADLKSTSAREACQIGVNSLEHAINLFGELEFPNLDGSAFHGATGRARLWSHVVPESHTVKSLTDLLIEKQVYVCPTLLTSHRYCSFEEMANDPYLDYMTSVMPYHRHFKRMRGRFGMALGGMFVKKYMSFPSLSKSEQAEVTAGLRNIRDVTSHLLRAGVNIVAGTDSPNPSITPGFSLHQEMELMVRCGMPQLEVLKSATSVAGRLLRRNDLGVVKPGACADLVLLKADPTNDITNTTQIQSVIKAGMLVDREKVLTRIQQSLQDGS